MQELPSHLSEDPGGRSPIRPGALVRARGARWRVAAVRPYAGCTLVTLVGLSPPLAGVERTLLTPFDAVEPCQRDGHARFRFVGRRSWGRAWCALLAREAPPASLRTAASAALDVLPHQLEPALAVLRGVGSRLLLADEVGLGKTIQAGLVLSELRARGAIDRVLVLTPAGLRDQWQEELATRFGLPASVVGATALRRHALTLPVGVNPWSTIGAAVASVDFVKRPEVLAGVAAVRWDALIVDEAHGVAGDSERRAAVRDLASRALYVLLLTATPHSGDRVSFAALCNLGTLDDDPLVVFRRTRAAVRPGATRRVHTLPIRLDATERRMHARLAVYGRAIRDEHPAAWLGLSVLHKRALSCPWSLARSVERRLAALSAAPVAGGDQLPLPLGDPRGEFSSDDEAPPWPADVGLADTECERRLLIDLAMCARTAAESAAKISALQRLLRRVREPVIVFTEYRDTLLHVHSRLETSAASTAILVLHGGLSRAERAAVLRDFAAGRCAVLLATDAAGEGLNLHQACRIVINLELPWNPMRLEQRIGRVDRIGQTRSVHAFHLIAAETREPVILARLRDRIARAQSEVGAPDPIGGAEEERVIARLMTTGDVSHAHGDDRSDF